APTGTRIEHSELLVDDIERTIMTIIPPDELESISDNIGLPTSYDLAFYQTDSTGPQDADVLIQLKPEHRPTAEYQDRIRSALEARYPNVVAYFQAADIISQVLNFGLPAMIDAQINGNDLNSDFDIALRLKDKMARIPGLVDLRIGEPLDYPTFKVEVDRAKALQFGIAQVPQQQIDSLGAIANIPLSVSPQAGARPDSAAARDGRLPGPPPQLLGNLATVRHDWDPAVIAHYSVQRVIDVNAAASGRDLGSVSADVQRAIDSLGELPPGTHAVIRGQSAAMRESFRTLGAGLILAIILVYLLMVANFQSWLEPFIIMMAVPGALAGVLWMLAITGTTINVESLMGAIMAVGVGVANGNLLITFANELREDGYSPVAAAIQAGRIRFRPIIMTALAMILGMLPMALALGSGSEQNAPLGRAVIGGLLAATAMTLFVVPAVYSIFSRRL